MLTYNIPNRLDIPLYQYIYECIKKDIKEGNIKANEKLPSKRNLSRQLEVSLITVENAYSQLLIEGYITAIEKRGYFVNEVEAINTSHHSSRSRHIKNTDKKYLVDFVSSAASIDSFPFSTWSKLSRKVLSEEKDEILRPSDFKGSIQLRKAISEHLYDFFKMKVDYNQIIVGSGSEYLYSQLVQLFDDNTVYALEDPGHTSIKKVYSLNNCKFEYIPMDQNGISINHLNKTAASVVHVSSNHQYPTGITMPIKRRHELIKWARSHNAYIIEDDYDSEFRLKGKPVPPLYDIDSNHTIYMNTFSITLSSSFRIAYMILPEKLMEEYERKLGFYRCTVPVFDQLVLSRFIKEQHFERHISRMRKKYRESKDFFIQQLKNTDYNIKIKEADSGLHFLIEYAYDVDDDECEKIAEELNIRIRTLSYFMNSKINSHTIILTYMGVQDKDLSIKKLKELFEKLKEKGDK